MLRGFIFLVMLLSGKVTLGQSTDSTIYKMAHVRLGGNPDLVTNREGSFVLCTREEENTTNNLPVLKYLVIRAYDKKVVEEGVVTLSQVVWAGPYEIEISEKPGQVQLSRDVHSNVKKIDLKKHLKNLTPK